MQTIRKVLEYTSNLKNLFVIIALVNVLGAIIGFLTPFLMKYATDWIVTVANHTAQFQVNTVFIIAAGFLVIALLATVVSDIGGYFGDMMAIRTRRQLSKLYYEHLLTLPQSYFDGEVTGKIINRLSRAIADITQFLQFFSNNLLQMLLTMAITIIILIWYSWPLAVLFLLLIPANLYVTARTSGKWQKYEGEKNQHFDVASGRFAEVVAQMRLVKSFGAEKRELGKFDHEVAQMVDLNSRQSTWWHGMNALRSSIFGLIFAAIYGLLFYETAHGNFTIGDMVLLLTLIQQIAFPMRSLSFFVDGYQRAVANSKDYLAAMAEVPEIDEKQCKTLVIKQAAITYDDVSFGYTDEKTVLRDISFQVKPGQKVALVGESGGGKTTISNLLMRLYDPSGGSIRIDDVDISSVSRSSVRAVIATVFQDAALFSGTIRENIAYAQPNASDKQIRAAAKAANALEFIENFGNGFDTEIGERGIKLSGGQRQRIAIARALLKDAPILILDEATSSLDSRAEHEVQQALDHLMKGRTTIIIAHRLSTIASVDVIVTLKDGRIDEIGSPSQLTKSGGIYAKLLELQLGATEKAKEQLEKFDIAS